MKNLIVILLPAVLFACSNGEMRETQEAERTAMKPATEKVYIKDVQVVSGLDENNEVTLVVSGDLPTPAYRLVTHSVKVSGSTIEITPLATVNTEAMAAQVLVPFQDTLKVKLDREGTFTVKCNGRTDTVTNELTIKRK